MVEASIDILENTLRRHSNLLDILLIDRTRTTKRKTHNILWATDSYLNYEPEDEIKIDDVTGDNTYLIQPRVVKTKKEQKKRTKDKAEVFTPVKVVHKMNRQIDWMGKHWPADESNWQDYVLENKLEISCGEAPFIVGRYNVASGNTVIKIPKRVGFLDSKLRVVSQYTHSKKEWIEWTTKAFQASYGYEWQGDNLLLARENLLYTFIDFWNERFPNDKINLKCKKIAKTKMDLLLQIAEIVSWNIFQMDGIKFVVPMSCRHEILTEDLPPMALLWGEKPKVTKNECPGCKFNDPKRHNGKYAYIMDWKKGKKIKFVELLKEGG